MPRKWILLHPRGGLSFCPAKPRQLTRLGASSRGPERSLEALKECFPFCTDPELVSQVSDGTEGC